MGRVLSGLECFVRDGVGAAGLALDCRVGLVAHAASIDASGEHAVQLVRRMRGVQLVRLFAPEHGLYGHEQDMETVGATIDRVSGLPVTSLYGRDPASLVPDAGQLDDLDAVVFDCQDVGSRYYTYLATLSLVMEAARGVGLPVVVLDRPNPLGGAILEGPVLAPALRSFVGRFPIPVRHGMTAGELARLFNDAFGIGCDLRVVALEGWRRTMDFCDTGLPWVPPSPNMPAPATAIVYPGGCLIEGTNLSEGRGTTTPFELVGAPWLDAPALVAALRSTDLPGVAFRVASFRPMFQKFAGSACHGTQVIVRDASRFRPFATYLVLIREALRLAPQTFAWRHEPYEFETERLAIDLLLGRDDLRPMLERGASLAEIERRWDDDLAAFRRLRSCALLYRDD